MTYLNFRNINCRVVITFDDGSLCALIILVNIDSQRLGGTVRASKLHVVVSTIGFVGNAIDVLSGIRQDVVVLTHVLHFLFFLRQIPLHVVGHGSNVRANGITGTMVVSSKDLENNLIYIFVDNAALRHDLIVCPVLDVIIGLLIVVLIRLHTRQKGNQKDSYEGHATLVAC